MSLTFHLFFLAMGIVVGSFLNVLVMRYNTGKTIGGRSFCFCCGHRLRAIDLVPIFSFLFLKGKCRYCKSSVSFQYLLVELLTGGVFLLLSFKDFSPLEYIVGGVLSSLLIAIAFYDFRHSIIPDGLVYEFSLIALFSLWLPYFVLPSGIALFSGVFVAAPIVLLWGISHGKWIGLGDAKLMLGAGWLLGLSGGFSALLLSFWIGAAVSLSLLATTALFNRMGTSKLKTGGKALTMRSELPFAPFIVISIFIVYFFDFNIINVIF